MSQYLSFCLKKKDNTEISLGYFCTTPARQISSVGAFPYTDEDTVLDSDTFSSYLNDIKEEKSKYEKYLADVIKKKQEIEQYVFKCTSKEVAQMYINQIEDCDYSISDYEEEIEDWNWRIDKLQFIYDVWELNKKEWDLYYCNC